MKIGSIQSLAAIPCGAKVILPYREEKEMIIRKIELGDAENFLEMQLALDKETKFMMFEPGERPNDVNRVRGMIQREEAANNLMLVAEIDSKIVGFLSVQRGIPNRIKHSAYIVVGVCETYQRQGIGTRFFEELEFWAKNNEVARLELTVMCHNSGAKHLYEKNGFVIEGTKKNSLLVDDKYVDEYYMAKFFK